MSSMIVITIPTLMYFSWEPKSLISIIGPLSSEVGPVIPAV